jgi:hypothetical protein
MLHELAQEWAARRQRAMAPRLEEMFAAWRKTFAVRGSNKVRRVAGDGRVETTVLLSGQGSLPVLVTVLTPRQGEGKGTRAVWRSKGEKPF